MLEIRITAPEISEAINNLARAIGLAIAKPLGSNTITSPDDRQTEQHQTTPTKAVANPTVPVCAPQTAPVAQNTQNANYPTNVATTASAVPTSAPQYTLEMIAKAGTALIDAGKMAELSSLLAKYGVDSLTALDPVHYGTLAAELRAIGAAI